MEEKDEKKKPKKEQTAKEIAEIMVENMKANMNNPNFWTEKEEIQAKVIKKILKERKEREKTKE